MRRTLSAIIEGGFGLIEGEVWWMDHGQVIFWCGEVLDRGATHTARVDLGLRGTTVDIICEITRLWPREEARISRGFVLSASYRLRREGDADALHERLRQINPEFKPPQKAVTSPVEAAVSDASMPADQREPRRHSPPPSAPTGDPTLMLSPGRTPSLLVQFHSAAVVADSIRLQGPAPTVTIPAVGELSSGDQILAVLQIPPGIYIQSTARVERVAGQRLALELTGLSPPQLGQLKRAVTSD